MSKEVWQYKRIGQRTIEDLENVDAMGVFPSGPKQVIRLMEEGEEETDVVIDSNTRVYSTDRCEVETLGIYQINEKHFQWIENPPKTLNLL